MIGPVRRATPSYRHEQSLVRALPRSMSRCASRCPRAPTRGLFMARSVRPRT
ncbi:hypothetical protein BJV78DRAFT_1197377 [Lactifluus subvellereus]|nr:hypothetical protein BJV78DRAFT_1197377 [Lactifluus subvellereus]